MVDLWQCSTNVNIIIIDYSKPIFHVHVQNCESESESTYLLTTRSTKTPCYPISKIKTMPSYTKWPHLSSMSGPQTGQDLAKAGVGAKDPKLADKLKVVLGFGVPAGDDCEKIHGGRWGDEEEERKWQSPGGTARWGMG
jgi:hypothetical protein